MERVDLEIVKQAGYECVLKPGQTIDPNAALRPGFRGGKHLLNWHQDGRGGLCELWRRSWEPDRVMSLDTGGIQQVYVSETRPGIVKGWHLHPPLLEHAHQIDRFICIRGVVLIATYDLIDPPDDGVVTERVLHGDRLERIDVQPGIAHGWINIGDCDAWILNLVSLEYTGEMEWRRPAHDGPAPGVKYKWRRERDG